MQVVLTTWSGSVVGCGVEGKKEGYSQDGSIRMDVEVKRSSR
jgi:hypothetical protein